MSVRAAGRSPDVSVVVPVRDEEGGIAELHRRLAGSLAPESLDWELLLVDDGSRDGSLPEMLRVLAEDPGRVRVVELEGRHGQHAALLAGFTQARGAIVVSMDADLQNPPEEVPRLVRKLGEGWDHVGGVRTVRRDPALRRAASRAMNAVVSRATGVPMRDHGCMLRGYRRELVRAMLAEWERAWFLPVLAVRLAGRSADIEVAHAPRASGRSRYGPARLLALGGRLALALLGARGRRVPRPEERIRRVHAGGAP